jgi:hypothetical protein
MQRRNFLKTLGLGASLGALVPKLISDPVPLQSTEVSQEPFAHCSGINVPIALATMVNPSYTVPKLQTGPAVMLREGETYTSDEYMESYHNVNGRIYVWNRVNPNLLPYTGKVVVAI